MRMRSPPNFGTGGAVAAVPVLVLVLALALISPVTATVLLPAFSSCLDKYEPLAPKAQLFDVSAVYAQMLSGAEAAALKLPGNGVDVLRFDLIGTIEEDMPGYNATTDKLATMFTTTAEAGVVQYTARSWVCNNMFPASLSSPPSANAPWCNPFPKGDWGISISVPLSNVHALSTITTRMQVVDTNMPAQTLACVDIRVTPYEEGSWPYKLFLWFPAAIAIAYFVVEWAARFAAGWVVGVNRTVASQREATLLKWGTMFISGLSGERLSVSAALLRFVTPGVRDIFHHIQFITMMAMIAVNWPTFFYPIVTQSSWANLVWNVSLVIPDNEYRAIIPQNYTPPEKFAHMMNDPDYPLYLNSSSPDRLLDLNYTRDGMPSFARMNGLRREDLFGTCLSIFCMLAGVVIVISLALWFFHFLTELLSHEQSSHPKGNRNSLGATSVVSGAHSRTNSNTKEWFDPRRSSTDLNTIPLTPSGMPRSARPSAPSKWHRTRRRFSPRGSAGVFHFNALYGNLLRLILTFHFPITAFSVYQLTIDGASIVSRVFAALAFAFLSIIIPAFIMWRISRTPTGKLYDAARTLLALGTMYNVYEQEKQLYRSLPLVGSLVSGIVIGAGQGSGLAQAIVLVIVELFTFVATTFWSPWGRGASMGAVVIFLSITRIVSMVMAVILSREVGVDEATAQWLAYVILILQALVMVFFLLMIFTKIVEGLIRLFGGAPFDESTHPIDGGIFAAIMDLDCLNGVRGGKAAARKLRKRNSLQLQHNVSVAGSLTTQMILDRHSQGVDRQGNLLGSHGAYYPVQNPSVNEFGNRVSTSDQGSSFSMSEDGHVWRPAAVTVPEQQPLNDVGASEKIPLRTPPMSPGRPLSMGNRVGPPPAIRTDPRLAGHGRAYSSSSMAAMEELATPTAANTPVPPSASTSPQMNQYPTMASNALMYPPTSPGSRADRNGTRPPPLTIPRRRSLNNIRVDDEGGTGRDGHNKRRSWSSAAWFRSAGANSPDSDPDSDDEPGPSRRRRRREASWRQDESSAQPPRWRALFTRKHKHLDKAERDENAARKAMVVNESGALFAGVEAPVGGESGFRVQRKKPARPQMTSRASGSGNDTGRGSVVATDNERRPPTPGTPGTMSTAPLLAPPPQSFRVKRRGGGGGGAASGGGSAGNGSSISGVTASDTTPSPAPTPTPPASPAVNEAGEQTYVPSVSGHSHHGYGYGGAIVPRSMSPVHTSQYPPIQPDFAQPQPTQPLLHHSHSQSGSQSGAPRLPPIAHVETGGYASSLFQPLQTPERQGGFGQAF